MNPDPILFTEGRLTFSFPPGWDALKYDESTFHKKHFQSFAGGSKAVDFVAFKPDELWLIEVKDYRARTRTKSPDLFEEIARKVQATLAGLVAVKSESGSSGDTTTRDFSKRALRSFRRLRIAVHLEQSGKPSRLFPHVIDPKNAHDKLRKTVHAVDPRAIIGNAAFFNSRNLWAVAEVPSKAASKVTGNAR